MSTLEEFTTDREYTEEELYPQEIEREPGEGTQQGQTRGREAMSRLTLDNNPFRSQYSLHHSTCDMHPPVSSSPSAFSTPPSSTTTLLSVPSIESNSHLNSSNNNTNTNTNTTTDATLLPRKVYVENLPLPVTESLLTEWFEPFGSIERIHIGTDKSTGKQLGFAFIEFYSDSHGLAAIAGLHGREMNGRVIRCSVAKKKAQQSRSQTSKQSTNSQSNSNSAAAAHQAQAPTSNAVYAQNQQLHPQQHMMMMPNGQFMMMMMPPPPSGLLGAPPSTNASGKEGPPAPNQNLFINGIPFSWVESDLMKLFQPYGAISHTKILTDPSTGKSKGQGFVHYDSLQSAQSAITAWNGHKPPGSETFLQVRYAFPKKDGTTTTNNNSSNSSSSSANNSTSNPVMPPSMPPMPIMSGPNPMAMPIIPMGYQSYPAGGFPAVPQPYSVTPDTSSSHHTSSNESSYGPDRKGRTHVRHNPMARPESSSNGNTDDHRHSSSSSSSSSTDLFVFYLPKVATREEVTDLFKLYGPVVDVSIPIDKSTGESKGYAFVNMKERLHAEKAIHNLNGFQLHGKRLKVSFKEARGNNSSSSTSSNSSDTNKSSTNNPNPTGAPFMPDPSMAAAYASSAYGLPAHSLMSQPSMPMAAAFGSYPPPMMNPQMGVAPTMGAFPPMIMQQPNVFPQPYGQSAMSQPAFPPYPPMGFTPPQPMHYPSMPGYPAGIYPTAQ